MAMSTLGLFLSLLLFCAIVQCGWAQESLASKLSCGQVLVGRLQRLIAHSNDAPLGAWPWHTAIFHVQQGGRPDYKCGGTLISENFVLTGELHQLKKWIGI